MNIAKKFVIYYTWKLQIVSQSFPLERTLPFHYPKAFPLLVQLKKALVASP